VLTGDWGDWGSVEVGTKNSQEEDTDLVATATDAVLRPQHRDTEESHSIPVHHNGWKPNSTGSADVETVTWEPEAAAEEPGLQELFELESKSFGVVSQARSLLGGQWLM
jgi:hypothetical protein